MSNTAIDLETVGWGFTGVSEFSPPTSASEAAVVLVSDQPNDRLATQIKPLCEYLGVSLEQVSTSEGLGHTLRTTRPVAVVSDCQAGVLGIWHIIEAVVAHDRHLPTLVVTGSDRKMGQVVQGVAKLWQAEGVETMPGAPATKDLVEFLFRAGMRSGIEGLLAA
ncbi:MAG: hypothetical protein JOY71_24745 [Acetobacteraceae bacterium]|nr:hypothetical protein [Acetobacteraceae bacterium]MBV8525289.1 hypothetical protein [Acetobacteraceae bacterium]